MIEVSESPAEDSNKLSASGRQPSVLFIYLIYRVCILSQFNAWFCLLVLLFAGFGGIHPYSISIRVVISRMIILKRQPAGFDPIANEMLYDRLEFRFQTTHSCNFTLPAKSFPIPCFVLFLFLFLH